MALLKDFIRQRRIGSYNAAAAVLNLKTVKRSFKLTQSFDSRNFID